MLVHDKGYRMRKCFSARRSRTEDWQAAMSLNSRSCSASIHRAAERDDRRMASVDNMSATFLPPPIREEGEAVGTGLELRDGSVFDGSKPQTTPIRSKLLKGWRPCETPKRQGVVDGSKCSQTY